MLMRKKIIELVSINNISELNVGDELQSGVSSRKFTVEAIFSKSIIVSSNTASLLVSFDSIKNFWKKVIEREEVEYITFKEAKKALLEQKIVKRTCFGDVFYYVINKDLVLRRISIKDKTGVNSLGFNDSFGSYYEIVDEIPRLY